MREREPRDAMCEGGQHGAICEGGRDHEEQSMREEEDMGNSL